MREGYGIGELARRAGVPVANIRYYEEVGILPPAGRGQGGQRRFDEDDLRRLRFVKNCRELGFPLKRVRALVHLSEAGNQTCNEARNLAADQLAIVRERLAEFQALEAELTKQVADCDAGCLNGPSPSCSIFTSLSSNGPAPAGCCGPPPLVFPDKVRSATLPRR
jgi:DNA-binding transcriptional MerR regulator